MKNGTLAGTGDTTTLITGDNESTSLIAEGMTITSKQGYAFNANNGGTSKLTNCTLTTESEYTPSIFLNKADATLNNCTVTSKINNTILLDGGSNDSSTAAPSTFQGVTLTIGKGTTVSNKIVVSSDSIPCTIVVEDGCDFKPDEHYDSSNATITNNGNTWTLTPISQNTSADTGA